jgi:hypothetical protein
MVIFVQPNMQAQEELAALFSRNLSLQPAETLEAIKEEPKIVYISQHYTHSAHIAKPAAATVATMQSTDDDDIEADPSVFVPTRRPASEPPQPAVEDVLRAHGVDASCLSTSQLRLFRTADEAQKCRLIELWRICPPSASGADNPTVAWCFTTVGQEEVLAKARWEERQRQEAAAAEEAARQQMVMSMDGTPLTPIQSGDGRWFGIAATSTYMEPYMASGYEEMARREYEESARRAYAQSMAEQQPKGVVGAGAYNSSTDPVYASSNGSGDWVAQQMRQRQQQAAMEDQYGRMMQSRNDDEEML